MRNLLWRVAQHKYGWAYVQPYASQRKTAEALQRRGLVRIDRGADWTATATDAGRAEIERRWPVSPFVLGTYEEQPGGWTPRDGAPKGAAPRDVADQAESDRPKGVAGGA
jgi:hypothetical protein